MSAFAPLLSKLFKYPEDLVHILLSRYGVERCFSLLNSLKTPGLHYAIRVNTLKIQPAELVKLLKDRDIELKRHPHINEALLIPVKGPYEVPVSGKKVVAEKYAAESVMVGSHLYAPGVLSAKEVRPGDEVYVTDVHGQVVGYGIARLSNKEMGKGHKGLAVEVLKSRFKMPPIRDLPEYLQGLFYDQSIPAMLASIVLEPSPGDVIVDMCAAPGGKATHIAQLIENKGIIYAFDNSRNRFNKLVESVKRLSATCVTPVLADSRYISIDYPSIRADKVIVDPPCSALGVRPKLYENNSVKSVLDSVNYQKQFLSEASKIVKPGGLIVYSTCTIMREENEELVLYAEEKLGLQLEAPPLLLGSCGEFLPSEKAELVQRFYPDKHDTPGYFIARFRRKH